MVHAPQLSPGINTLIGRLDDAVARLDPRSICEGVHEALEDLAREGLKTIPEHYLRGCADRYARHLLHRGPEGTYSAMVMVWQPGQGTPVHDHAGNWCVECVIQGRIEIVAFDPTGDASADDVVRLTRIGSTVARRGDVGILVPPNEYHSIRNVDSEQAVTVHVYAGDMLWCHAFHPLPSGGYRRERCDLAYYR